MEEMKRFLAHHLPVTTGLVMVVLILMHEDLQVTRSALLQMQSSCRREVAASQSSSSRESSGASNDGFFAHHLESNKLSDTAVAKIPITTKEKLPQELPVFHIVMSKTNNGVKDPLSIMNMRCIESVFYFHPTVTLLVHTNNETGLLEGLKHPKLKALVERGYDLQVNFYRPQDILQRTIEAPGSQIDPHAAAEFSSRIDPALRHEKYWYANEANLVRLCILYLQGGIYLDSDVVLINDRLATDPRIDQAMGRHRDGSKYHNAAMKFTQPGNRFLAAVINNMIEHYDGSKWGNNGPKAFGRTAKEHPQWVCPEDKYDYVFNPLSEDQPEMNTKKKGKKQKHRTICYLTPFPNDTVAPFSYKDWDAVCFEHHSPRYKEIRHKLDHSFLVHFNNKKTEEQMSKKAYKKGSLCDHVLSSYCVLCED
ncbi:Alpha 1,4-glycosyltransferase conserved region [Seminavis robusta]|uniref:Alpha 1,4-glycosyltransferase conserved region n=1 Tax=Seminavis robusta TaxID=568900 RepID=A0A9N8HH01_9STRA|nr:Alpha 1,4-glycosyltransferase conserved region [Seminavis robusta]|eukprot:Sro606_g174490.1 Alpha 1,4-glycosyltransferase conserved region (423) ;mRNA; r:23895-25239